MARFSRFVELQTISGPQVTAGDVKVTPRSQTLTVRLPFGGFVWNRPASVLVERNGRAEVIPIVDVTRIVQLGLLGLPLVISFVFWTRSLGRKES